jgi:hypothetical protein
MKVGLSFVALNVSSAAFEIVDVVHVHDVPAIGLEPLADVLVEGECGVALDRDVVAVVDPAQVGEFQVAGDARGLGADAFHHVAVAAHDVDVMVEQRETGLVVARRQPALGDRHADRIAATLPERACRRLDTGGVAIFGVAGGARRELTKLLDVVEADRGMAGLLARTIDLLDARQMQQRVEQHRGVADRQHETVAVGPLRRAGIVAQIVAPHRPADRRERHRRARVARVRLLHRVHRQRADRVDLQALGRAVLVQVGALRSGSGVSHRGAFFRIGARTHRSAPGCRLPVALNARPALFQRCNDRRRRDQKSIAMPFFSQSP